jgi:hypothetical protein
MKIHSQVVRQTSRRRDRGEYIWSVLHEKDQHIRANAENGRACTGETPEKAPIFFVDLHTLRDKKEEKTSSGF